MMEGIDFDISLSTGKENLFVDVYGPISAEQLPNYIIQICPKCNNIRAIESYLRPFCPYCVGAWSRRNDSLTAKFAFRLLPKSYQRILDFMLGLEQCAIPIELMDPEWVTQVPEVVA